MRSLGVQMCLPLNLLNMASSFTSDLLCGLGLTSDQCTESRQQKKAVCVHTFVSGQLFFCLHEAKDA